MLCGTETDYHRLYSLLETSRGLEGVHTPGTPSRPMLSVFKDLANSAAVIVNGNYGKSMTVNQTRRTINPRTAIPLPSSSQTQIVIVGTIRYRTRSEGGNQFTKKGCRGEAEVRQSEKVLPLPGRK